jgi:hypothetical protein
MMDMRRIHLPPIDPPLTSYVTLDKMLLLLDLSFVFCKLEINTRATDSSADGGLNKVVPLGHMAQCLS